MWRYDLRSRTPHGVRGLKCELIVLVFKIPGRTPHGVRGLKCQESSPCYPLYQSHPSRGAWIEIRQLMDALGA